MTEFDCEMCYEKEYQKKMSKNLWEKIERYSKHMDSFDEKAFNASTLKDFIELNNEYFIVIKNLLHELKMIA